MSRGRITIMALSVMGLFAVRHFETDLFYDPLKPFFNGAYKLEDLPEINTAKWVLSLMGRYFLNSILALLLLHAIFRKKTIVQFSAILHAILLGILLPTLILLLHVYVPGDYHALFYVRRFLIHPLLLLLLLIPSFFITNSQKKP